VVYRALVMISNSLLVVVVVALELGDSREVAPL
jgi:hypothetical protein